MPQPKRLKPFTFFGKVPSGVTTVELTKLLVQKFSKNELGGVQDFGGGKFEIFIKTREAIQRFLKNPVLEVKGKKVPFEYRGTRTKLVRVFGYSSEHQDVELAAALQQFGKIVAVSRESVPGFPTVTTGIRRIKMDMKAAVPNFMTVVDTEVMLEYEGVVRVCRRCDQKGHMSAKCEAPQCDRCGEIGHNTCAAACPRCGEDHPVRECKTRTFADVVGDEEEEAPEMWQELEVVACTSSSSEEGDTSSVAIADSLPEGAAQAAIAEQTSQIEPEPSPTATSVDARYTRDVTSDARHVTSDAPAAAAPAGEREETANTVVGESDAAAPAIASENEESPSGDKKKKARRNAAKRKRDREGKKTQQQKVDRASKTSSDAGAPKPKKAAHFKKNYQKGDSECESGGEPEPDRDAMCEHCGGSDCDCSIVTEHSIESTEFRWNSEPDEDSDVT